MSAWSVIAGALAAAVLAWVAIALVAWIGQGSLRTEPIRWLGAAALVLVPVDIAGAPIPWALPPALLGIGLAAGLATAPEEEPDP